MIRGHVNHKTSEDRCTAHLYIILNDLTVQSPRVVAFVAAAAAATDINRNSKGVFLSLASARLIIMTPPRKQEKQGYEISSHRVYV